MPGLYDFEAGRDIAATGAPFYALIQAAMRTADTTNFAALERAFPAEAAELRARYNAPGGVLDSDRSTT